MKIQKNETYLFHLKREEVMLLIDSLSGDFSGSGIALRKKLSDSIERRDRARENEASRRKDEKVSKWI